MPLNLLYEYFTIKYFVILFRLSLCYPYKTLATLCEMLMMYLDLRATADELLIIFHLNIFKTSLLWTYNRIYVNVFVRGRERERGGGETRERRGRERKWNRQRTVISIRLIHILLKIVSNYLFLLVEKTDKRLPRL